MTNFQKMTIWGRQFSLPIIYDCYQGETVTEAQTDALKVFISHLEWIEMSKKQVESYCKDQVCEDDENQKKDNIFSYIKPDSIFVKRDKTHPRVALMCKYRYDPEHGLAVVFSSQTPLRKLFLQQGEIVSFF